MEHDGTLRRSQVATVMPTAVHRRTSRLEVSWPIGEQTMSRGFNMLNTSMNSQKLPKTIAFVLSFAQKHDPKLKLDIDTQLFIPGILQKWIKKYPKTAMNPWGNRM